MAADFDLQLVLQAGQARQFAAHRDRIAEFDQHRCRQRIPIGQQSGVGSNFVRSCALIGDADNFWMILGPVLILYTIKVRQEERSLGEMFPAAWADYVRTTPRFFPRLACVNLSADWNVAQWIRSREYQALLATVAAFVAIKVWQLSGSPL